MTQNLVWHRAALEKAKKKVDSFRSLNLRQEEFNGKAILREFYRRYLHKTGLPKDVFIFYAAYHACDRKAVKTFFEEFFENLLSGKTHYSMRGDMPLRRQVNSSN